MLLPIKRYILKVLQVQLFQCFDDVFLNVSVLRIKNRIKNKKPQKIKWPRSGGGNMGRKSVDEIIESNLTQVISMLKDGSSDKEIIEFLGISRSAWKAKKNNNMKLKQAIEEVREQRNEEVEEALFKNCKGYSYYEEVAFKVKEEVVVPGKEDENIILNKERVEVRKVLRHKGPDITSIKYWLNNKKKLVWKDDPHKVENDKKITKLKEKEVNAKVID